MSTEVVASWTPVIVKGGVFQKTFTFTDENDNPVSFLSAEIVVTPNGAAEFSWTQANGKFTNTGTGEYYLNLSAADTTAYTWTSGTYRLSIVELSGNANPCLIEGLIFAKDC